MAVTKTIAVDGKDVTFRASRHPRLYETSSTGHLPDQQAQKGIDESSAEQITLDNFWSFSRTLRGSCAR